MIIIHILKNGKSIKQTTCEKKDFGKNHADMFDIAGGMWNGKDEFSVKSEEKFFSYKCKKCGSTYTKLSNPLTYVNCIIEKPITHEKCGGELVEFILLF